MKVEHPKFNLRAYIIRNWSQYLIYAVLLTIYTVSHVIGNVYNGNSLTSLVNHDLHGFTLNALITLLAFSVMSIFIYIDGRYGAKIIKKIDNMIRGDLADRFNQQEYEEFNSHTEADYVSWFTNDINQINRNGYDNLTEVFTNSLTALLSSILLFTYNPTLLLSTAGFTVILILFPLIFKKKLAELSTNMSNQNQVLTAKLTDVLEGFTSLLMIDQRKLITKKALGASEETGQAYAQYTNKSSMVSAIVNLISVIAQISLTIQTGYLAFHNLLPIGAILTVGSLSGNVFGGLTGISNELTSIRAVQPLFDKFNFTKNQTQKTKHIAPLTDAIEFDNLSFSYEENGKKIFKGMTGQINQGERVALLGPSGCGKSTFVKILAGLLTGYQGKLTWDQTNYNQIEPKSLRQQIAYIDQNAYIFDGTLQYNITVGRETSEADLQRAISQAGLNDFVENSPQGLDTILQHAGNNISGGQKQRIAIARSLLKQPTVIIADEITSALDEKDGQKIEQGLLNLDKITLVYISHHLRPEIAKQFDHVLQIEQISQRS